MIVEAEESDPILVIKLGYKSGFEAIFHPHGSNSGDGGGESNSSISTKASWNSHLL